MDNVIEILAVLLVFLVIGHALNAVSENIYWKYIDWRASKKKKDLD